MAVSGTRRGADAQPWGRWVSSPCSTGKRGYLDRDDAKKVTRAMAKSGKPGTRPYLCSECQHWHTGNIPVAVRRGEEWESR